MDPRRRVQMALNHQEPDRVPIDLGGTTTTIEAPAYKDLLAYLGLVEEIKVFVRLHVEPSDKILDRFGVDTRYVHYTPSTVWSPELGIQVDEWGVGWERKGEKRVYFEPVYHPLHDAKQIRDLEKYRWPLPPDSTQVNMWTETAKRVQEETHYAVVGDQIGPGLFERAWLLRGLHRFMLDICRNPSFVEALLDKVLEIMLQQYDAYLSAIGSSIDVIMMSDDLGTQHGPMINPEFYRKIVKPRQKILIEFIKKKTNAKIFLHSCGAIREFIKDFIDIGIDILNPIQVGAKGMGDTASLKREFGKDIVFWGAGCDAQRILPFGKPEDVEQEVKRRIEDLAPGGGFVFAPIHNIQPGVPPENIAAMFEAALRYGRY